MVLKASKLEQKKELVRDAIIVKSFQAFEVGVEESLFSEGSSLSWRYQKQGSAKTPISARSPY